MRILALTALLILTSGTLSACSNISTTESPLQTATSALTVVIPIDEVIPTLAPFPLSFYPPIAVNTPHPTAIALKTISDEQSIDLYHQRLLGFKNTILFKIESAIAQSEAPRDQYYYVQMYVTLTNVSKRPLIIPREFSYGWINAHVLKFLIKFNGQVLNYRNCCTEHPLYLSADEFISLFPAEFERYSVAFLLPLSVSDASGRQVHLANEAVTISAIYQNTQVGFPEAAENYRYQDIDAWVGQIESNQTEIVLP